VSSATNTLSPGTAGNDGGGVPRPNPVALEEAVSVTGAKATANAASRDLFTEETSTVLVFKDGAVIRLTAPVKVGQLLFLTNKKSNQEVVCQVLHRKDFQGTSSYVELKFTEDRADYWGVAFPEKKNVPEFKVVEQVRAEEVTAESPQVPVKPHTAQDVDLLKREVEALREQLESLQSKQKEEAAAKAKAEADAAAARAELEKNARESAKRETARIAESLAADLFKLKEVPPPANTPGAQAPKIQQPPAEEEKPELLMPAATNEQNKPGRATVGMSLPVWKMEKSPEEQLLEEEAAEDLKHEEPPADEQLPVKPSEELLPTPSLDFSQLPKGKPVNASRGPRFSVSPKVRTAGLGVVLLLALVGGVWYGKLWKLLPIGKREAASSQANVKRPVAAPHPATAAATADAAVANASNSPANSPDASNAPAQTNSTVEAKPEENRASRNSDSIAPTASEEPAQKSSMGKGRSKGNASPVETLSAASPESAATDAPLVDAKLLKAANPVYPPDAMRSYITGDVKAEVTVEANGHVSKVSVLSGPKALRDAAVEALKQYEYAPATQAGKSVPSKTTEIVKFWFNP
jgi:TonB family protein